MNERDERLLDDRVGDGEYIRRNSGCSLAETDRGLQNASAYEPSSLIG